MCFRDRLDSWVLKGQKDLVARRLGRTQLCHLRRGVKTKIPKLRAKLDVACLPKTLNKSLF